jgi:hypothetical protein
MIRERLDLSHPAVTGSGPCVRVPTITTTTAGTNPRRNPNPSAAAHLLALDLVLAFISTSLVAVVADCCSTWLTCLSLSEVRVEGVALVRGCGVRLRSSPEQVPRPVRTRRIGRSARWSSSTGRTAHTGASTGASAPGWKPTRHRSPRRTAGLDRHASAAGAAPPSRPAVALRAPIDVTSGAPQRTSRTHHDRLRKLHDDITTAVTAS